MKTQGKESKALLFYSNFDLQSCKNSALTTQLFINEASPQHSFSISSISTWKTEKFSEFFASDAKFPPISVTLAQFAKEGSSGINRDEITEGDDVCEHIYVSEKSEKFAFLKADDAETVLVELDVKNEGKFVLGEVHKSCDDGAGPVTVDADFVELYKKEGGEEIYLVK